MAKVKIGMPSRSRGTTLTGLRTDSDTALPASQRSMAISPPEFPNPTTSTLHRENGFGFA